MKTLLTTLAIVLGLTITSPANALTIDRDHLNTFKTNLEYSLNEGNDGVQFWSLFLLARLKSDVPSMDLTEFNRQLNRLIDKDASELIRVNAKMTYLYLNEASLASEVKVMDRENPLLFYSQLYMTYWNKKFQLEQVDKTEQIKELVTDLEALESQL